MKYEIASQTFPSKTHFKAFMRQRLTPELFDPQDPYLYALLSRHLHSAEKIGVGVKMFRLEWRAFSKTWEPRIMRLDGSSIDFSWVRCINGAWMNHDQKLRAAMRSAVAPQVLQFLRKSRDNKCAICDEPRTQTHVDHINRFEDIAKSFLIQSTLNKPDFFDDHPTEFRAVFKPEDARFKEAWERYHGEHATLQLTCATCNLKRG